MWDRIFRRVVWAIFIIVVLFIIVLNINRSAMMLGERYIYWSYDQWLYFLFGIIFLIITYQLYKLLPKTISKKTYIILLVIISILFLLFRIFLTQSFWLELSTDQAMFATQLRKIFTDNDLSPLKVGGYLNYLKHQFQLFILFKWIVNLIGFEYSSLRFYILNCFIITISIANLSYFVYKLRNEKIAVFTLVMLNLFIPINLLVAVVYGDLLQLLFFTICLVIYATNIKSITKYILMGCCLSLSYMARPASLIFVIALVLLIFFFEAHTLKKKVIYALIILNCFFFPRYLLNQYYISFYNIEEFESFPMYTWILNGITYNQYGYPGNYNSIPYSVYSSTNDMELTNNMSKKIISENLNELKNMKYLYNFLKEKTYFTWTDPDFDTISYYFPNNFGSEDLIEIYKENKVMIGCGLEHIGPLNSFGEYVYENWLMVRRYEKAYYFAILFLALLVSINKKIFANNENILMMMLFVGDFLLQLLLETRPRYVLIYFIVFIVFSCMNVENIETDKLMKVVRKLKK